MLRLYATYLYSKCEQLLDKQNIAKSTTLSVLLQFHMTSTDYSSLSTTLFAILGESYFSLLVMDCSLEVEKFNLRKSSFEIYDLCNSSLISVFDFARGTFYYRNFSRQVDLWMHQRDSSTIHEVLLRFSCFFFVIKIRIIKIIFIQSVI